MTNPRYTYTCIRRLLTDFRAPDKRGGQTSKILREFHSRHDFEVLAAHRCSVARHRNVDFRDGVHVFQEVFDVPVGGVEGYVCARHAAEGEGEAS